MAKEPRDPSDANADHRCPYGLLLITSGITPTGLATLHYPDARRFSVTSTHYEIFRGDGTLYSSIIQTWIIGFVILPEPVPTPQAQTPHDPNRP